VDEATDHPGAPVSVVPEDGLRRLLPVCAGKDFEARRDTAIITVPLDTGARSGELAGLTLSDVDFDLDMLVVLGKGRRDRALPFGRTAALALDRYLRTRARHPQAHLDWLWFGKDGLTASGLAQMLERRGRQAGRTCTPTGCGRPSPTSGSPKVVARGPHAVGRLEVPCDGPLVMNTREELLQAFEDYHAGVWAASPAEPRPGHEVLKETTEPR
jgi:Phage integrase family/Pirin C-terminal cupin domain